MSAAQHSNYGRSHFLPWIVVGIIVVIALCAAALFVSQQRSNQLAQPHPQQNEQQAEKPASADSATTDSSQSATSKPATKPNTQGQQIIPQTVPQVTVGDTYTLDITHWNKKFDVSNKLGIVRYELIDGDKTAKLTIDLAAELPESCAAMRDQFGFKQVGGKIEVVKPANSCAATPELFNEIWGLLEAAAKTAH